MKLSTILWVIVPGVGQIRLGRAGKGLLLFTLFAVPLNTFLLCLILPSDPVLRMTLLALTVLAWLISTVDYVRESAEREMADVEEREESHAGTPE